MVVPKSMCPILLVFLISLVHVVSGQVSIVQPSSDIWWVAKSVNTFVWTCEDAEDEGVIYAVLLENKEASILNDTVSLLPDFPNFDCSKLIPADVLDVTPGDGYTVSLIDPSDLSQVYAKSEEFTIRESGSEYPTVLDDDSESPPSPTPAGGTTSEPATPTGAAAGSTSTEPTNSAHGKLMFSSVGLGSVLGFLIGLTLF